MDDKRDRDFAWQFGNASSEDRVGSARNPRPWSHGSISACDLGMRFFEDINYGGDSCAFASDEYVDDLTQFNDGLGVFGGDWNDMISSVAMARCYCQAWEHIHEGGASLTLVEDTSNLHNLGWGDRISRS